MQNAEEDNIDSTSLSYQDTAKRLPDSDVRAIFEYLHEERELPEHISFTIVPAGCNGQKLSPPSYEFDDGLYVLLKPYKKRKSQKEPPSLVSEIPGHLKGRVSEINFAETCKWGLSGPQFPQPTAIQQRYCYPKGTPEYSSAKGGALWTMYGKDGREDLEYRLLHVYYSAKRAFNRGVNSLTNEGALISPKKSPSSYNDKQRHDSSTAPIPFQDEKTLEAKFSSPKHPYHLKEGNTHYATTGRRMYRSHVQYKSSSASQSTEATSSFGSPKLSAISVRNVTNRKRNMEQVTVSPDLQSYKVNRINESLDCGNFSPSNWNIYNGGYNSQPSWNQYGLNAYENPGYSSMQTHSSSTRPSYEFIDSQDALLNDDVDSFTVSLCGSISDLDEHSTLDPFEADLFDTHSCGDVSSVSMSEDLFSRRLEMMSEKIRNVLRKVPPNEQPALTSKLVSWARAIANNAMELNEENNEHAHKEESYIYIESSMSSSNQLGSVSTLQAGKNEDGTTINDSLDDLENDHFSSDFHSCEFRDTFETERQYSWDEGSRSFSTNEFDIMQIENPERH